MGAWGIGIDENDTFQDVYQSFFYLYDQGGQPAAISKQLQSDFSGDFTDHGDARNDCLFALALAQWETASLGKTIYKEVKKIIETGSDLERFSGEGDKKSLEKRKKALDKFLTKISIDNEKPKPRKKRQKEKLGNVYAIPLPNGKFGFCRSLRDAGIAVYQHIGDSIRDLPKSEEYRFIVAVYRDALTNGKWPIVENRPFENEEESWPPPTYMWNAYTGKYRQYHKGQITPSTKAACQGLEKTSVWESNHIIDRIMGDDTWQKITSEWSYIQRYGQEAFDELTKDS